MNHHDAKEFRKKYKDAIDQGANIDRKYLEELHEFLDDALRDAMNAAERVFQEKTGKTLLCYKEATPFAFAGPDEFKYDTSIDTLTAYKRYISSKPWAASNYLRDPSKKPNWL